MTETAEVSAVRAAYDAMAADYTEYVRTDLAAKPLDRAMLTAFAELVQDAGPVADLGCGTGRVAAYLDSLGVPMFGLDLSPEMIALARRAFPGIRFDEGSMIELDLPDGTLGGIVAWYSVIHVPPPLVPAVFAGFHRVLAPGGHLLLAFQVGDEPLHLSEAFGKEISLDFHRLLPDRVVGQLGGAGFDLVARLVREPENERTQQAFLLARKP